MKPPLSCYFGAISLVMSLPAMSASFQGLGDLPGSVFYSYANNISADGKVIVGASVSSNSISGTEAFRWTSGEGMAGLGDLPGGDFAGGALCTSADGSVIGGVSMASSAALGFRWNQGTGMTALPDQTGHWSNTQALAISGNGEVVVGYGASMPYGTVREAMIWPASGGSIRLGDLPGGDAVSCANGVSADGSVVVGEGSSANGHEGFRWTSATGMLGLGDLPGGYYTSAALAVSADGTVVVGYSISDTLKPSCQEAFRWTAQSGMVGLGIAEGDLTSVAYAVSADGNTIVGSNESGEALIWRPDKAMRHLRDVLIEDYHLDLTGWKLTRARGISADGLQIVGWGYNPSGQMEGWLADMAPPSLSATWCRNQLTLSWPTNAFGWVIEQSACADGSAEWVPLSREASVVGDRFVVTETADRPFCFYRLRKP